MCEYVMHLSGTVTVVRPTWYLFSDDTMHILWTLTGLLTNPSTCTAPMGQVTIHHQDNKK